MPESFQEVWRLNGGETARIMVPKQVVISLSTSSFDPKAVFRLRQKWGIFCVSSFSSKVWSKSVFRPRQNEGVLALLLAVRKGNWKWAFGLDLVRVFLVIYAWFLLLFTTMSLPTVTSKLTAVSSILVLETTHLVKFSS